MSADHGINAAAPRPTNNRPETVFYGGGDLPFLASGVEVRHVLGTATMYAVSRDGRVFSRRRSNLNPLGRWIRLKPSLNAHGYESVCLCVGGTRPRRSVHTLVLLAFVGPCPPGHETRHLNNVRTDNRWPENICWGTPKENEADKVAHGTDNTGERNGRSRMTDSLVYILRWMVKYKLYTAAEMGRMGILLPDAIRKAVSGRCWKHVEFP